MKKIINDCFCMEVLCQKTSKNIISTLLLFIVYFSLNAQNSFAFNKKSQLGYFQQKEQKITVKVKNEKLSSVLTKIEKQVQYVFVYSDDDVNAGQKISIELKGEDLHEVLEAIAKLANISYEIINDKIILRGKSAIERNTTGNNIENGTAVQTTDDKFSRPETIVTGKITDEAGSGVPGVSVTVKGTSIGAASNVNGNYNIALPDNINDPVLLFSYIGYINQEIAVDGRRTINVVLQRSDKILEDVVVVGYGTQRRTSVTGSVDAIGKKAIEGRPVAECITGITGRFSESYYTTKKF